jgi:hypothetical protein
LFTHVDDSIDVLIKKSQLEFFFINKGKPWKTSKKKWFFIIHDVCKYNKHIPFNNAHLPHGINAHDPITYVGGAWGLRPHA